MSAASPSPPSAPSDSREGTAPRRLLIVEDHALLGKLFREIAGDLCIYTNQQHTIEVLE